MKYRLGVPRHPIQAIVMIVGITAAGFMAVQSQTAIGELPRGVVALAVYIGFLALFPAGLPQVDITLVHVAVLTGGLVYTAGEASTALLLGIVMGMALRLGVGALSKNGKFEVNLADMGFEIGLQAIPLAAASNLFSMTTLQPENFSGTQILGYIGMFVSIHALILYLVAYVNRNSDSDFRQAVVIVTMVELIPAPLIWLAVVAFSLLGPSTLLAVAVFPALLTVLLNQTTTAQRNLNRRLQDLSALQRVSQLIQYANTLNDLFQAIQEQIKDLLDIDNFYVALFDENTGNIWYPLAVKGGEALQWAPRPLSNRLTDRVIQENQPILLGQQAYQEMERIGAPIGDETLHAWLGAPLTTPERTAGCLAISSFDEGKNFGQEELILLTTLAGQVSVALENALLYEQLQKRAVLLETLYQTAATISATLNPEIVFQEIASSVSAVSGGQRSALYLLDSELNQVILADAHGLSEDFILTHTTFEMGTQMTRCLEDGQPTVQSSIEGQDTINRYQAGLLTEKVRAYIDLPLMTPDGPLGFLTVYFEKAQDFPQDEVDLLQTFVTQAAMAISNANLHAQTGRALAQRAEQLKILEEVGRKLSASLQSKDLYEIILEYALNYTGSEWGGMATVDEFNEKYEMKVQRGYDLGKLPEGKLPGLAMRSIQEKRAIITQDITKEKDYIDLTGGRAQSQLAAPMVYQDRVLGVLTLESVRMNEYTESEMSFVGQLADQASLALLNASLYSETQRWLHEQATLHLVSARLVSSQELHEILRIIAEAFSAALNSPLAGVYLWDEASDMFRLRGSMKRDNHQQATLPDTLLEELMQTARAKIPLVAGNIHITEKEKELRKGFDICDQCEGVLIPLVVRGQEMGMVFIHVEVGNELIEEDLNLAHSMATQCAIAIQNALLLSDVTQGRDKLETVLDAVGDSILMIDANGVVTVGNAPLETLINFPNDQLTQQRFTDLSKSIHGALGFTLKEAKQLVAITSREGDAAPLRKEYKLGERFFERAAAPVWGAQDEALGWVIVIRDVTEEHALNQTRELMTETLVHDLRSPIGVIQTTLHLLEESLPEDSRSPVAVQSFDIAQRGVTRALGLVESLLDINQLESGNMEINRESAKLTDLVDNAVTELLPTANESEIVLTHEAGKNLSVTKVDIDLMQRTLINLIDNALKFTPEGGRVTVKSGMDEKNRMLLVKVIDTGPGVPEEFRVEIFQRFTQVPDLRGRRRGSGLGLTLCQLVVEAHGGRIWVEDGEDEVGAAFCFTLPISDETIPIKK